ncbi:hypothetical protein CNMCM8980_005240 [Aspergillus fumigatiaffinis]|uniref:F-box domain-containing protein n=1 Tax=Aspergillus fumigatiaffinis TaxID=340414 RepID=A0A8H4EF82_9EURO|nr:hypothetical protein CNMCM5878_003088 [Aspergillus fumigatiaffinis]KAF4222021.1 hypothetical protein CNMCM6457_001540 [Aspergillus fumigatiaffinis]KAF4238622.1 hypothetical protein CNMCM6805_006294 [Aspergillus fumigatiaffinis]KAF4248673.1 hypothetical protein CNMCM8980_005240 [Aspergillus fumigatiaffinis]
MSAILQELRQHAKIAGAAIRRSRKSEGKKPRRKSLFPSSWSSSSVIEKTDIVPTSSPWDLLPVEIQIKIFAQCGIKDLLQLKLVCKAFCQVLTFHEQLIARQYLRQARHGTLPSPIDSEREYTRNPEDDVVLLSDLFPPAKSAKGGHLYTFRYMHSLRRRAKLCSKLCYYLADRVMDRFVHCEPAFVKAMFPSRNERNEFLKRGKSSLWFNLIPLMYYTLYFLEAYSLARRELKNALLQDMEAGRLPVPVPPDVRKSMYRELQIRILRSAPFTNTSTLICTHHCMQLLVSYLRHTVPPEEPVADDSWIGSLLTASPFLRIVEYFSAEIGDGGSQRVQRKDFMRNFHNDLMLNEKDDINSLVFESTSVSHLHSSVQDVWFDVAREELASRRALPHDAENIWVWKGVPVTLGDLFTSTQAALSAPGAVDDDVLSRTGPLKDCVWETLSAPSTQATSEKLSGILVTLEYENITYKAALLAAPDGRRTSARRQQSTQLPLLLTRFPNPLRQTFISFLSANFDTYCSVLRLPSTFMCTALEMYIDILMAGDHDGSSDSHRVFEDTIKETQLTLSFSPPVAPALRSLNINLPRGSFTELVRGSNPNTELTHQKNSVLSGLSTYLEKHLAMKLNLGDLASGHHSVNQPVRLTKIACGSFVLGGEGKMKLVAPSRQAGSSSEDGATAARESRDRLLLRANEALLQAVIRRAAMSGDEKT